MFDALKNALFGEVPKTLEPSDERLALGALMVRIARADGDYDAGEKVEITAVLQDRFQLSADDAMALRKEAEALELEAPDTVRFTKAIKQAVEYDARSAVVTDLWKIVLADGEREQHEDSIIRSVAGLLGVSDKDSALARQRAAGK